VKNPPAQPQSASGDFVVFFSLSVFLPSNLRARDDSCTNDHRIPVGVNSRPFAANALAVKESDLVNGESLQLRLAKIQTSRLTGFAGAQAGRFFQELFRIILGSHGLSYLSAAMFADPHRPEFPRCP